MVTEFGRLIRRRRSGPVWPAATSLLPIRNRQRSGRASIQTSVVTAARRPFPAGLEHADDRTRPRDAPRPDRKIHGGIDAPGTGVVQPAPAGRPHRVPRMSVLAAPRSPAPADGQATPSLAAKLTPTGLWLRQADRGTSASKRPGPIGIGWAAPRRYHLVVCGATMYVNPK